MVQSINTKAIFTLASVLRRPSLLIPHVSVDSISQIDYAALQEHAGVRAICFDKDNTLTAPYDDGAIHPKATAGLKKALDTFGPERVAILSNSAGTASDDPGYQQAQAIEEKLGIAVIRHEEKKPGGLQDVMDHFDLQDPAQVCMVGDRVLTDVVFGNLHGMLTIHTMPLCQGKEENQNDNWTAKLLRPVENYALYNRLFGLQRVISARAHKFWSDDNRQHSLKEQTGDDESTQSSS